MSESTRKLHDLGQSLWVDNITRTMLNDGTLQGYIDDYNLTGLTSNPTIFDKAISEGDAYDEQIEASTAPSTEERFFELAITDLTEAAEMFAPIHSRTDGVDGYVSLEVSPLLADDTEATHRAGGQAPRPGGPRQHLHQDPRDAGRSEVDRGLDLRGHPCQRHPAVLR